VNQRVNDVQDSSSRMNRVQSLDDVADYSVDVQIKSSSSQHATSSERRFSVSQMSWAVVVTHLATLTLWGCRGDPPRHSDTLGLSW